MQVLCQQNRSIWQLSAFMRDRSAIIKEVDDISDGHMFHVLSSMRAVFGRPVTILMQRTLVNNRYCCVIALNYWIILGNWKHPANADYNRGMIHFPLGCRTATMAVAQHTVSVCTDESIPVPTWICPLDALARRRMSLFPCKNQIVYSAFVSQHCKFMRS